MTTREIEKMAIELMTQHGLIQKGWKFEWNKRKNNFGLCNEKKKAISLSLMTIPFVNVEKIKDTVLHEIAHALVGVSNQHNNDYDKKLFNILSILFCSVYFILINLILLSIQYLFLIISFS